MKEDGASKTRMGMEWQERALVYYDTIGELRYASHFYARQLSRVRYYPALQRPDGTTEEITDGPPVDLLNRIQDAGGGRSQLQYNYGRLMFVTGEGVLFGSRLGRPDERWKFLWKKEVTIRGDTAERVMPGGGGYEPAEVGVGYRLWNPHPRHSDDPDSPMRAIMDVAEELLLLTASVRSTATSRMTKGVFVVPLEAIPVDPATEVVGMDEDPENNVFLDSYIEHVTGQIEDPASAEAQVPFLFAPPYDFADKVRWLQTHDPQNDYLEQSLRTEAIKRMALGLDMPPEALLGMTDANHWTAKQVQHDIWRSHGMPKAEQFADDLAEAYLRPALEDEGYANWDDVVIAYDDSQVVISPDRTEDAFKAVDRIIISREGARELLGFSEDLAPDEKETEFLASMKLRGEVEMNGGELVLPQRGPLPSSNGDGPAEEGPSEPSANRSGSRQESMAASARILGAAELALLRCRELAGIRIRHKCKDCAEGYPDSVVASVIGSEQVGNPLLLVKGGADGLRTYLSASGFDDAQALSLCQTLEVYAARTLFDGKQPDLPAGFIAQVEKAKEVSSALSTPST